MKFEDSGLPNDKLVEDAFNYSYKNVMANEKEALEQFEKQVKTMHTQQMMILQMNRKAGPMEQEEFEQEKKQLEKERDEQLKLGPAVITRELEKAFANRRLGPARELVAHAEEASGEALAAVLLVDCVRSPLDYKNITAQFGDEVADLIAEVAHIQHYPSEREENVPKFSEDSRRAYQSRLISALTTVHQEVERAMKQNPDQRIQFSAGHEEELYRDVRLLWGTDKKLDARLVEAFNQTAKIVKSDYRMEIDAAGALELAKGAVPPKKPPQLPPPKGPGGNNGGLGGDVF